MISYDIVRQDGEDLGLHTTDLDAEDVLLFLEGYVTDGLLVRRIVDEECVEEITAEAWISKCTYMDRKVKPQYLFEK